MKKKENKRIRNSVILLICLFVFIVMFRNMSFSYSIISADPHTEEINVFVEKFLDLLITLIQASILWLFGTLFYKKYYKSIYNDKQLEGFGIQNISSPGMIKKRDMKKIFNEATTLKICHVSSTRFARDYKNLMNVAVNRKENPLKVEYLICEHNSEIINGIENIECFHNQRTDDQEIAKEIDETIKILSELNSDNVKLHLNRSSYFLPYIVAYFENDGEKTIEAHLNIIIPPRKASDSICITAIADENDMDRCLQNHSDLEHEIIISGEKNIAIDLDEHFKFAWNNGKIVDL